MKKLLLATALLFSTFAAQSQTACELNYRLQCDEEVRLIAEKKALECRLAAIHDRKQELIACVAAEKNRVELDAIKRVLTQTLETVNSIQSKPLIIPKICPTGNCN
jgi:hypothetical protein